MNHYDLNLCSALAEAGVEVTLMTSEPAPSVQGHRFLVDMRFRGVFGKDPAWRRGLRFVRALIVGLTAARVRGNQIAHFHFFNVGPLQALGVAIARMVGMRVVATVHDVEAFKNGLSNPRLERFAYSRCNAVVVHNQVSRTELAARNLFPSERLHVVNAGNHKRLVSQLPEITRADAAHALGVDPSTFIVVFFGQIKEVKGLGLLLRAVGKLKRRGVSGLTLVIGGRTWKHDFSEYQESIDEENIADIVKLHVRFIPDNELPYFYRAADLMVMPYLRIYQSDVLLMAMTFGTPILVSDLPGMLEVVRAGESALVFQSGNVDDLAQEIEWAMGNREALKHLARNAALRMHSDFEWGSVGVRLREIFDPLANPLAQRPQGVQSE